MQHGVPTTTCRHKRTVWWSRFQVLIQLSAMAMKVRSRIQLCVVTAGFCCGSKCPMCWCKAKAHIDMLIACLHPAGLGEVCGDLHGICVQDPLEDTMFQDLVHCITQHHVVLVVGGACRYPSNTARGCRRRGSAARGLPVLWCLGNAGSRSFAGSCGGRRGSCHPHRFLQLCGFLRWLISPQAHRFLQLCGFLWWLISPKLISLRLTAGSTATVDSCINTWHRLHHTVRLCLHVL